MHRPSALATLALVALLSSAPAAADPSFDRIVTFGDSLSDPGNAYLLTGEFVVRPFEPTPSAPYLIGRFHFTNGPTWVEQLARTLRLPASARPALAWPGVYTNYAVGGARARSAGGFDLSTQVGLFLFDFDGVASSESLYAVWIGSNDARDALMDPAASDQIILDALEATRAAITALWNAGAQSFLVLTIPNLADTPSIRALPPEAQAAALMVSKEYNEGLAVTLDALESELEGIEIITFDVFAALSDVVAHPEAVGLKNVTDSCIRPGVIFGAICRRPDLYLFWDFVHPTKKAHQLLSEQAQAVLEMAPDAEVVGFLD